MKLVREYLYEAFSEESDPVRDMGIGWDNLPAEEKYKVPLKERPSHVINQKQGIHSRGYHLWKLLKYILDAGDEGRRYSELVNYDSNMRNLSYKRRTFASGIFDSLKRYTDKNHKKDFHRYVLNSSGYWYFNHYKKYFDDGKDFSNENN